MQFNKGEALKQFFLYLELMRFFKPIGTILLVLPLLWTLAFITNSMSSFLAWGLFFTLGAFIMRSAGCIMNDLIDIDIDKKVIRTATRPLANGKVTPKEGVMLLVSLLFIALVMLLMLPSRVWPICLIAAIMSAIYPLMKRYVKNPQIFLGFTFNLGILIVWFSIKNNLTYIPVLIYLATALWTMGYDTIYAHQDKEDDMKINVNSSAILWGEKSLEIILYTYKILIGVLCIVGLNYRLSLLFYIGMGIAFYYANNQIESLDINNPEDCKKKFLMNQYFGVVILISIIVGRWGFF